MSEVTDVSPGKPILVGLVGSKAYGLARPESDDDHLGVFAFPTKRFTGLHPPYGPSLSHVTTKPDITYHELLKYMGQSFKCNPSTNELMWLPDDELWVHMNRFGARLIQIRSDFLSEQPVKDAYYGYCNQQFKRIVNRWKSQLEEGETDNDRRKKVAKHARHLYRLSLTLRTLWREGTLRVDVSEDREAIFNFGDDVAYVTDIEVGLRAVTKLLDSMQTLVDETPSVLPLRPNETRAEQLLQDVRRFYSEPVSFLVDS